MISTNLSSSSLLCSSASFILLLIPSSVFFHFHYCIVHLCLLVFFFFKSSISLLNISCISPVCTVILFLRSWIIFTVVILNSFSGRLPNSTSLNCSSGVLLVPSSRTYFGVVSVCLTFCICGFRSTDCKIIVLLASSVCPLVAEVGLVRLPDGRDWCLPTRWTWSCLSGGQGHIKCLEVAVGSGRL